MCELYSLIQGSLSELKHYNVEKEGTMRRNLYLNFDSPNYVFGREGFLATAQLFSHKKTKVNQKAIEAAVEVYFNGCKDRRK